jgi:hypothetical protein
MVPSDTEIQRRIAQVNLAFRLLFAAIMTVLLFAALSPLLQRYESHIFPVVERFRVTEARAAPDGDGVLVSGDMIKRRDCRFISLSFYAGVPDDYASWRERLTVRFEDQPVTASRSRASGWQSWGPWRLSQPAHNAYPSVFMVVNHRCHGFWRTSGVYFEAPFDSLFPTETNRAPLAPDPIAARRW